MIGKLLGHTQVQTTARYAHLASDPVVEATDKISERLAVALFAIFQKSPDRYPLRKHGAHVTGAELLARFGEVGGNLIVRPNGVPAMWPLSRR